MGGIFTKRIWESYICQPNRLIRDIKKKTGVNTGGQMKIWGVITHPDPLLESPLHTAEMSKLTIQLGN